MRKLLCSVTAIICAVSLCACSQARENKIVNKWDCTVVCATESSDTAYVITYSDEKIVSTTGVLTVDNRNDFDIVVHLFSDGQERVEEIPAGGVNVFFQIEKDIEHTLGCHADLPEGTEIRLYVYDGEGNLDVNELLK